MLRETVGAGRVNFTKKNIVATFQGREEGWALCC